MTRPNSVGGKSSSSSLSPDHAISNVRPPIASAIRPGLRSWTGQSPILFRRDWRIAGELVPPGRDDLFLVGMNDEMPRFVGRSAHCNHKAHSQNKTHPIYSVDSPRMAMMCAPAATAPTRGGFTTDQIGGIIGQAQNGMAATVRRSDHAAGRAQAGHTAGRPALHRHAALFFTARSAVID